MTAGPSNPRVSIIHVDDESASEASKKNSKKKNAKDGKGINGMNLFFIFIFFNLHLLLTFKRYIHCALFTFFFFVVVY